MNKIEALVDEEIKKMTAAQDRQNAKRMAENRDQKGRQEPRVLTSNTSDLQDLKATGYAPSIFFNKVWHQSAPEFREQLTARSRH